MGLKKKLIIKKKPDQQMTNKKIIWKTEKRTPNQLIPYVHNSKIISDRKDKGLSDSLAKFGLAAIPVINKDNTIIDAHRRILKLIKLGKGDEEIDVRVPNRLLTEKEIQEYIFRAREHIQDFDPQMLQDNYVLADLIAWGGDFDEPGKKKKGTGDSEEGSDGGSVIKLAKIVIKCRPDDKVELKEFIEMKLKEVSFVEVVIS
jgi:hypothetical protein